MQEGDKGGVWDIVEKGAEYADFVTYANMPLSLTTCTQGNFLPRPTPLVRDLSRVHSQSGGCSRRADGPWPRPNPEAACEGILHPRPLLLSGMCIPQ